MGCLFVMFAGVFPRLALLFVWVARPKMVDAAFDTWIWPLLGIIFLPFATLMYVVLWRTGGLSGWDWFWDRARRVPRPGPLGHQLDAAAGGAGLPRRRLGTAASRDPPEPPSRARGALLGEVEQAVPRLRVRDRPRIQVAGVERVHPGGALGRRLQCHRSVSFCPSPVGRAPHQTPRDHPLPAAGAETAQTRQSAPDWTADGSGSPRPRKSCSAARVASGASSAGKWPPESGLTAYVGGVPAPHLQHVVRAGRRSPRRPTAPGQDTPPAGRPGVDLVVLEVDRGGRAVVLAGGPDRPRGH